MQARSAVATGRRCLIVGRVKSEDVRSRVLPSQATSPATSGRGADYEVPILVLALEMRQAFIMLPSGEVPPLLVCGATTESPSTRSRLVPRYGGTTMAFFGR